MEGGGSLSFFILSVAVASTPAFAQPGAGADANKSEGYQFDANAVLRDPFETPLIEKKGETEEDEIIRYDVKEIKLVAIMRGMGASKIMVKLPNNRYHILQVGDVMGKSRDTVFKIENGSITMEKTLKDFKGNKKSQLYKIEIETKKPGR